MRRVLTVTLLLLVPALSGCLQEVGDGFDRLLAPRADVAYTVMTENGWNWDGHFDLTIMHVRPVDGAVELTSVPGGSVTTESVSANDAEQLPDGTFRTDLNVDIPDGTWNLRVIVGGHTWDRLQGVRIDTIAPVITGLEQGGHAPDGTYRLGDQASYDDGTLEVFDADGDLIGTQFPVIIEGLDDDVHVFYVVVTDAAGNEATQTVQVVAGKATDLPRGEATFGIVSRYTIEARLWDLSRADEYLMPAEARAEATGYLDEGHGITPNDPVVQAVVDDVVSPSMTTMEAAWALYEWLFDELEYDDERLQSTTLMLPRHVIEDSEDDDAEASSSQDARGDGLSDDGDGNGVRGGVCRDLAGTYVSLLRAAGVPARLVTGYLAGTVNGFHAWVEVYVGELGSQLGWMPVDVSPIDGTWDEEFGITQKGPAVAMQAFGIRLPDYLPLRTIEADEEIKGWSTAIGASYSYPSDQDPPEIEFIKGTVDDFQETEVLCVDTQTNARAFAERPEECSLGNVVYGWNGDEATFVTASVQVIDYGVKVSDAPEGSSIDMEVAYPFEDELGPVIVEYEAYAPSGVSYNEVRGGYLRATVEY